MARRQATSTSPLRSPSRLRKINTGTIEATARARSNTAYEADAHRYRPREIRTISSVAEIIMRNR